VADTAGDAQLTSALESTAAGFSAVEAQLQGTGEPVWNAWRELTERASSLPVIAADARQQIIGMAADQSKPEPYRRQVTGEIHQAANELINKMHEAAKLSMERMEATLVEALYPRPAADINVRNLKRDEATRVVARAAGSVPTLIRTLGRDAHLDAEILGDWGRALLSDEDYQALRAGATARLIHIEGGTERQAAARAALVVWHRVKLPGLVAPLAAISRARLG
jgi:hypothetical protein